MDKSWMLNPKAIRIAKECINIVKEELDIKLTLSHPEFMQMLHEYVDLTDSAPLADAYSRLLAMAGVGNVLQNLKPKRAENANNNKVTPISPGYSEQRHAEQKRAEQKQVVGANSAPTNTVEVNGKSYPASRDGKTFKGLYRGQPIYK